MLRAFVEVLPLFIVRLLARDCEAIRVGSKLVHVPRPGVMIEAEERLPPVATESQYALGVGA